MITAEDYIMNNTTIITMGGNKEKVKQAMIEFAKIHVDEALRQASKRAKITMRKVCIPNSGGGYYRVPTIYKTHILKAYSTDNIK